MNAANGLRQATIFPRNAPLRNSPTFESEIMKKTLFLPLAVLACLSTLQAQPGPEIGSWLQNQTVTGTYYNKGNPVLLQNGILVNCQKVQYSDNWVYVSTQGVPAYPTGPFLDGNPSKASAQNAIFRFPRKPVKNAGTPTPVTLGNIGHFINGVALFDYRDDVAWNTATNSWCGGPGNPPCQGPKVWNRDAIVFERLGFDCAKGHPAMGNYHHHQNPSAFDLDQKVISDICNLYDSDGLYVIDSTVHSPLLGFAYDGFPIYGAYGYRNADGSGGIIRIRSGYSLRSITVRTHHADGTDVADGPPVSATYPLGTFREDYEWTAHPGEEEFLDVHNGRFCVTPEYPNGTYAYFATVSEQWNSVFPYVIGPTYYGVKGGGKVSSINESVTTYDPATSSADSPLSDLRIEVLPNPADEFIAIQVGTLLRSELEARLWDLSGKMVASTRITAGSTIGWLDVRSLYNGSYILELRCEDFRDSRQVAVMHE